MPLYEGRCPNCGSILQLDSAAEKGHCLFCDAVFANKVAFDIASNPAGVVFPNEPQPRYEGPNLDPVITAGQSAGQRQVQKVQKKAKPELPPVYIPKEPAKLPDIRLSGKMKLRIGLIALAVILLITGISVPLVLQRNQTRAKLLEAMDNLTPFELNVENAVSIWHQNNDYLVLSSPEPVSESIALGVFKAYCEKRAEIQNIPVDDFRSVYGQVTVKLLTPEGGFLIAKPKDQAELDSGAAVEDLAAS